jgi:zinc transport system permease protein
MFTEPFMQRALLAALFLSPLCALLGVFVTARRMAFFSDTISHAALAGIALGFWLGMHEPTLPLILSSLSVGLLLLWLKENTALVTDTIMALLLSGTVAFGVVVMSLLEGFQGELHAYLFGDILAVSWREVQLSGGLLAAVAALVFWQLSPLTLLTTHEEVAHVCGVRVRWMNYLFVVMLTLTVALSIRLLGIILVTSLIVIPPAAARNLSRNLRQQIGLSLGIGWLSGVGGIALNYPIDVPCGPLIVLTSIGIFLLTLVISLFRRRAPLPA